MPEIYEVEVVTNEEATATFVPASGLELEVHLENTSATGAIGDVEVVEVTILGAVQTPTSAVVYNWGDAAGLIVLDIGAPVPPGTPAGAIILRK